MSKATVPVKFRIEQIALAPLYTDTGLQLLKDLGLTDWVIDKVVAEGKVFGDDAGNVANLYFNYQAGNGNDPQGKPLELEVLEYTAGHSWLDSRPIDTVSHIGMHVNAEELEGFREFFRQRNISVAQEVITHSHTNEAIAGKRRYQYVIFNTVDIIGVDLKFIVRLNPDGTPYTGNEAISG